MWSMSKKITMCIMLSAIVSLSGCVSRNQIVKSPDVDMLVTGYSFGKVHVSACKDGQMIDIGWVKCKDLEGWTLTKFDEWNLYCK